MKQVFFILLCSLLLWSCKAQFPTTDYFGETPPASTPKVFAKGIISLPDRWEGNVSFSPDGRELYFNVFQDSSKTIYQSTLTSGKWTDPKPMPEVQGQNTWEPFIDWEGERLYFVSDKAPGSPEWNGRIWSMNSNDNGDWNTPEYLKVPGSPKGGLWFPNTTKDGKLYFGGSLQELDSVGQGDLFVMNLKTQKVRLLKELCSPQEDWDPFIAPDGTYILWASDRPGGYGGTDLYISFRNPENGTWGSPKNLGKKINTKEYEVAPRITPDGNFLFFDRPIKGTQDSYWVRAEVFLKLRE